MKSSRSLAQLLADSVANVDLFTDDTLLQLRLDLLCVSATGPVGMALSLHTGSRALDRGCHEQGASGMLGQPLLLDNAVAKCVLGMLRPSGAVLL